MAEKQQKEEAPAPIVIPAPEPKVGGPMSTEEIEQRLRALEPPKPEAPPVWLPPRAEDLVFAEVGPKFQAVDDVTRKQVTAGGRGYFTRELLGRHPEGFKEVFADGKTDGPFRELRMNTRLITGPPVEAPEPLIPRPAEGAPAA
jgi:hypothetical protein